jgi:neurabin
MDEKKGPRFGGSKVSEIANRFQAKVPSNDEAITPIKTKQKVSSGSHELLGDPPGVTVMRTESHVTRFNNARALFEKLGEENRSNREKVSLKNRKKIRRDCFYCESISC